MAEHTKLPWRVEKGTGLVWGDCTIFEDGTPDRLGVPVTDGQLERPWSQGKGPTYDEIEANADLIVKAVNNHDTLVKALETIRDTFWRDGETCDERVADLKQIARDALAAVGKVEQP
jgi:hypothetical protein